jgi:hypothetical protein
MYKTVSFVARLSFLAYILQYEEAIDQRKIIKWKVIEKEYPIKYTVY